MLASLAWVSLAHPFYLGFNVGDTFFSCPFSCTNFSYTLVWQPTVLWEAYLGLPLKCAGDKLIRISILRSGLAKFTPYAFAPLLFEVVCFHGELAICLCILWYILWSSCFCLKRGAGRCAQNKEILKLKLPTEILSFFGISTPIRDKVALFVVYFAYKICWTYLT